jgi:hypothetical protein
MKKFRNLKHLYWCYKCRNLETEQQLMMMFYKDLTKMAIKEKKNVAKYGDDYRNAITNNKCESQNCNNTVIVKEQYALMAKIMTKDAKKLFGKDW